MTQATQVDNRMSPCTSLEVRRVGRRVCQGSGYAKLVGGGMGAGGEGNNLHCYTGNLHS